MNALVVCDSQYGNTAQIARAIAARLEGTGTVRSITADDGAGMDLTGVDLLVIGGPTQAHGPRQSLRVWLDGVPPEGLRDVAVATFDTRLHWPAFLSGSAARTAARTLRRKGGRLVAPPESFFVNGKEGPLAEGELDRATAWAESLALKLAVDPAVTSQANERS